MSGSLEIAYFVIATGPSNYEQKVLLHVLTICVIVHIQRVFFSWCVFS